MPNLRPTILRPRRFATALLASTSFVASAVLVAGAPVATAAATKPSPIYGPKEQPLGRSYGEWIDAWARFALNGPSDKAPILHVEACNSWAQPEPTKVFFLGAAGPGKYTSSCAVPSGLPIVLTPGGAFSWNTDDKRDAINEELKSVGTAVRRPRLLIDGRAIDVTKHLAESAFGTITIEAAELGPFAGKGPVTIRSKGWMVVVKPLSNGRHTIVTSDELQRLDDKGQPVLVKGKPVFDISQVTFTIDVGP